MRQRVLVTALQGALAFVVAGAARAAEPESASAAEAVSPASAPRGLIALSLGTAVVSGETTVRELGTDGGEGPAEGGGTVALSYQKALGPYFGLRAFGQRAGWSTQLSEAGGDGDRVMYDLGAAPALTLPLSNGPNGVSLVLLVPVSFSLSHAPARAPRDLVREEMDLGKGYRIGVGLGMLTRLSQRFALLVQVEHAEQRVSHERVYRWSDGTGGRSTQSIDFRLSWTGAAIGLAFMP